MVISDDFSQWTYWWRANRDRFIRLKETVRRSHAKTGSDEYFMGAHRRVSGLDLARLTESDTMERILPALKRLLDSTRQHDITETTMVALGKIGRDHPRFRVLPLMEARLSSFNSGVRQTAAVAMGISQMPAAVVTLGHLVRDDATGRRLVERTFVDDRLRSFAAYGMGLVAWAGDEAAKRTTLRTMAEILRAKDIASRNIRVAAIHAISILNPDRQKAADPDSVLNRALDELDRFYGRQLGRGDQFVQSHVPPAVAKLMGRGQTSRHERYKKLYQEHLLGASGASAHAGNKRHIQIDRAAAIALGQLASPSEEVAADKPCSDALLRYYKHGRDQQARYLCLISMGQIGGHANRSALLSALCRGKKALERPWAAVALGVFCHRAWERNPDTDMDMTVGDALLAQFRQVRTPNARAAFAIALGLARFERAGPELMAALVELEHQDQLAGYICMGLALMDYQKARRQVEAVCERALRRPELLKRSAVALGKLGDRDAAATLTEMLRGESTNLATLSAIAIALGQIGDRRSVGALTAVMANDGFGYLSRAFAAAALGGIADKELLPWNEKISANSNYRAAVETMADIL